MPGVISTISNFMCFLMQDILDDLLKDQFQNTAGNSSNEVGISNRRRRYSFSSASETDTDTDSDNDLLPHEGDKTRYRSIGENLNTEQLLLLSGFVYGYCLGDATWGKVIICVVEEG